MFPCLNISRRSSGSILEQRVDMSMLVDLKMYHLCAITWQNSLLGNANSNIMRFDRRRRLQNMAMSGKDEKRTATKEMMMVQWANWNVREISRYVRIQEEAKVEPMDCTLV